jgi:hypothetical protein
LRIIFGLEKTVAEYPGLELDFPQTDLLNAGINLSWEKTLWAYPRPKLEFPQNEFESRKADFGSAGLD